jgi:2-polyprenyl-3-methyl-5-hydroxy-6-metoxy-1,4-benzoquinol methylase
MKNLLLSSRFSLHAKENASEFRGDQLHYIEKVRNKIVKEFSLVPNDCPCGEGNRVNDTVISEIDRYGLPLQTVLCARCGTLRIDPYLDKDSLSEFYTEYYQQMYGRSIKVGPYFEKQKNYGRKFYELAKTTLRPNSTILEFGCGAGGALEVFKSAGHNVYGIEYSQELIDYGKSRGLNNLYYGSLQDFRKANKEIKFDLIYSNHVFEHVIDPLEYLRNCLAILSSSGIIVCAVPDIYNSHRYIFPNSNLKAMIHIAHIFNYSMRCLESIARQLGMDIERLSPDPKIRTATSDMPELWFKLRPKSDDYSAPLGQDHSTDYFKYLYDIEQNYLNGTNLIKVAPPSGSKLKALIKKLIKWKK